MKKTLFFLVFAVVFSGCSTMLVAEKHEPYRGGTYAWWIFKMNHDKAVGQIEQYCAGPFTVVGTRGGEWREIDFRCNDKTAENP